MKRNSPTDNKEMKNFAILLIIYCSSLVIRRSSFVIRHSSFVVLVLFILLLGFLLSGCATQLPLHREQKPMPDGPICRVAVLPFLNDSDFPLGDAIIHKVFATEFQNAGNYLVIQEGDIHKVYQQLHLLPGMTPTLEQLQIISDRVNAQLLITGI
ncbi:MAG: hypothetical protein JRF02_03305, partial [Deltaproteobacteria bacterium]|nr:hypothetical protein [Deltaproteobacteria bacterium]